MLCLGAPNSALSIKPLYSLNAYYIFFVTFEVDPYSKPSKNPAFGTHEISSACEEVWGIQGRVEASPLVSEPQEALT